MKSSNRACPFRFPEDMVRGMAFGLVLALVAVRCRRSLNVESEFPNTIEDRFRKYTPVRLTTDWDILSDTEQEMIPLLIEAAQTMDEVF